MAKITPHGWRELQVSGTALREIETLDYTVKFKGTTGIPAERIVDAQMRDGLCKRIREALPDEPERPVLAEQLKRFFNNELRLVPDVSALVGRAEQTVTRLSEGLAVWARRLSFEPFRLRVIGTAVSGKTQLALAVLNDADAAGRRALYACFNRPLADHFARVAPAGVEVGSFHQICDRALRAAGETVYYAAPGAFDDLASRFARLAVDDEGMFDELIIDEGQDFELAWKDALMRRLAPGGRVWWLEDPMQRLYERDPIDFTGWVEIAANTNFRCPRDVLGYVNRLLRPTTPIEVASPFAGSDVEFLDYADTADLIERTKRAVTLGLQAGFRKQDVAIVTFSGRERSKLMPFDTLGPHRLKSASNSYRLKFNENSKQICLSDQHLDRFMDVGRQGDASN